MARTWLWGTICLALALAVGAPPAGVAPAGAANAGLTANCHRENGRPGLEACRRALRANPKDQGLHQRLGYLYLNLGLYQESVDVFRAMTKKWPGSWRAHYDLATVYSYIRAYTYALPAIEAAVKRNSRSIDALTLAVVIYRNLKRNEDAFALALRAAGLGDIGSMAVTSYNYEAGIGTAKDAGKAVHWLERAARGGHVGAMNQMSALYLNGGLGVKPDEEKAKMWAAKSRQARFGDMQKQ
ncbi:MAG: tetratricopeptide repeat protein [Alphaproteobacteria bacterium]